MLIICLGTNASGSTWVFNVVRAIAERTPGKSISFFSETTLDFVSNLSATDNFIIVKCHSIDRNLINILSEMKAKFIITNRDPRDIAVSQIERFGADIKNICSSISFSFSSMCSVPEISEIIDLRYENDFMGQKGTVDLIARFMDAPISSSDCDEIFSKFTADSLKAEIKGLFDDDAGNLSLDRDTQWHPRHLSDGVVGKWSERLSEAHRRAVHGAFPGNAFGEIWNGYPALWDPVLFDFPDDWQPQEISVIECGGEERCLIWGPYLYLPKGRWKAQVMIEPYSDADDLNLKIDVCFVNPLRIVQLKTIRLKSEFQNEYVLEFDNIDHDNQTEIRIHSVGDGRMGRFYFRGVKITRIGAIADQSRGAACVIHGKRSTSM